ncbi:hypothetical protein [Micromonospora sp. RP3T]|uniref:hypothetical protein n=1 Tax=Micromonospora sp. RP3T TaxID=2135446 RepID=UPI000D152949|nr:hypothetical protein [Micromonospora sp. RP3T]PTA45446.1 hypothetical protein C8054_15345 [Micromonospora sp. RP3T]
MAFRTWGRLLLTALGVSVLAAAGQLGVAYGFGVVRLDGAFVDVSVNRWPAQLVWVAWFAAVATVAGAVLTERLARRDDLPGGTTELLSIAGVSALGAIVVAPLCMQPARAAELGGSVDPVWAAGICAVLGAVVGAGAAIAVLLKPPFGWGVAITTGIVWLLALLSVAPTIVANRPLATVRLGVLEPSWLGAPAAQRLAMLLLPTLALLAGGAIGVLARRAGHPPLVGGAAGAAGPVLVAFAYLTAGPGTAADRYQLAPYYGALIAVAAGALGATATSVLPRPGNSDAVHPTDILAPLPASAPVPTTPAVAAPVPATAGAPAPAHWDWPEAGGSVTPPSSTPRHAGPASSDDERPARSLTPAGARHDEDPARTSPMPGLLPPGRRTSAIDVLAAGRPEPQPSTGPLPAGSDTPGMGTTGPGTEGTGADELRTDARGADEPGADGRGTIRPVSAPEATGTDRTAGTPSVAVTPTTTVPARTTATIPTTGEPTASARQKSDGTTAEKSDGTAAEKSDGTAGQTADVTAGRAEAVPRATRARRSRATTRPTPLADDAAGDPADAPRTGRSGRTRPTRPTGEEAGPSPATPSPATPSPATPVTAVGATDAVDTAGPLRAAGTVGATRPARAADAIGAADGAGAADAATTAAGPVPDGTDARGADMPGGTRTGEPTAPPQPTRRPRSFFFDPEPAERPVTTSPRPRFPIFEDTTERAGDVRPAWPITPSAGRPARSAAATTPATGRDGDDATNRAEAASRPHHQGLPEPGRSTGWDALATNARPAGRTAAEESAPARTDDARTGTTVPEQPTGSGSGPGSGSGSGSNSGSGSGSDSGSGSGSGNVDREASRARHAGADDAEAAGGKSKTRRGLFRRNRDKGGPEPADETAEPGATTDDEYVDWVAGLASDDNADDARSLRTGRHHRD